MSSTATLFPTELIAPSDIVKLPSGFMFRPLQRNDYKNGHLETLAFLAYIGSITEDQWIQRFDYMKLCPETYFVLVIIDENTGKIAGTGTLVAERKFLFELSMQGHIEDICISKDYQGRKLGLALLNGLDHIARQIGCYKTILDCSIKNMPFYEKCGYEAAGQEMHHYLDERAREHNV